MTPQEYYAAVRHQLKNSFDGCHYVVASGRELLADGWDPGFLVAVEPVDRLAYYTVTRGMQVHLPVVGERSRSVLMPMDFELFFLGENHKLYTDHEAHRHLFRQIVPVCRHVEAIFQSRGIPYLLDYTPSGAHLLWHNVMDDRATEAVRAIGRVEDDLAAACRHTDPNDIKRWWGISHEAAAVFSGLGRLAELVALMTMEAFKDNPARGELPVTIADSIDRCINFDNSWAEGSPFMRSIRSPFSLHKKNHDQYHAFHLPPLVDVIGTSYDGEELIEERDVDLIVDCVWSLEKAAEHARRFSGVIPTSNDNLIDFVAEYREGPLFAFHQEFDRTPELPRGEALRRARAEPDASNLVRDVLRCPNPMALQPKSMMRLCHDLLLGARWPAKQIANLLRDFYVDPSHRWTVDFYKYPAVAKANFWARTFSALALWKTGRLSLSEQASG